jgi:two-component system chemotaxis response regulator CheB
MGITVKQKIKVLIVDDSALARNIIAKGLSKDSDIEVVGTAIDVYAARDKIVFKKPDVITLDVEMPKMDGVEFLKRLMPQYPLPVIMVSSMTLPGAKVTLEALDHGAVDFVPKPSNSLGSGLNDMMHELIDKVKMASKVDVSRWKNLGIKYKPKKTVSSKILEGTTDKIIAIGASTGGTVAITKIIERFPADIPGTVVVQHMPPGFTKMFADKLNDTSKVEVKEAEDGDRIIRGRVLIAPGDFHMEVKRSGGQYIVNCYKGDKVNGHMPSVEVLYNSIAEHVGPNALGVILTGMGRDGASAMFNMKKHGARTIAQDEKSSVVFGMPKEAYSCGGAEKLVNLDNMPEEIVKILGEM